MFSLFVTVIAITGYKFIKVTDSLDLVIHNKWSLQIW